jgi:mannose/fructose-specific phosphotransferase system component IIA
MRPRGQSSYSYACRIARRAGSTGLSTNIEVIAAVNLPMLIKLASVRETSSLRQPSTLRIVI